MEISEWTATKFYDAVESASGDCLIATEVVFMIVITVVVCMDPIGHPSLAFVLLSRGFRLGSGNAGQAIGLAVLRCLR